MKGGRAQTEQRKEEEAQWATCLHDQRRSHEVDSTLSPCLELGVAVRGASRCWQSAVEHAHRCFWMRTKIETQSLIAILKTLAQRASEIRASAPCFTSFRAQALACECRLFYAAGLESASCLETYNFIQSGEEHALGDGTDRREHALLSTAFEGDFASAARLSRGCGARCSVLPTSSWTCSGACVGARPGDAIGSGAAITFLVRCGRAWAWAPPVVVD